MEVLILGVYLEIFLFRIKWSKIRVRIIHGRALYTGKYGNKQVPDSSGSNEKRFLKGRSRAFFRHKRLRACYGYLGPSHAFVHDGNNRWI